jgi:hypothetical protein
MALDPISAALDIGGKLIDRLWPDKAQADQAKLALLQLQQGGELAQMTAQMDIDKAEAANASTFTSGWRPFVGWVCGAGLACDVIVRPLFNWGAALSGQAAQWPALDMSTLMPLLLGMLGLGAYRTYEKVQGVTK